MKNANISRLGGFTLIELLVVVLIIGILVAMALPQYFKAVERSRMTEAVTLMDSVVKAQRRKYMQTNHFAMGFEGLDTAPKGARTAAYFTKGDPVTGRNGNGFRLMLGNSGTYGSVSAWRMLDGRVSNPSLRYRYILSRNYWSDNIVCQVVSDSARELCADFCGVDSLSSDSGCCSAGYAGGCRD